MLTAFPLITAVTPVTTGAVWKIVTIDGAVAPTGVLLAARATARNWWLPSESDAVITVPLAVHVWPLRIADSSPTTYHVPDSRAWTSTVVTRADALPDAATFSCEPAVPVDCVGPSVTAPGVVLAVDVPPAPSWNGLAEAAVGATGTIAPDTKLQASPSLPPAEATPRSYATPP